MEKISLSNYSCFFLLAKYKTKNSKMDDAAFNFGQKRHASFLPSIPHLCFEVVCLSFQTEESKTGVDNPAFESEISMEANGKSRIHVPSIDSRLNHSNATDKLKDDTDYKTTEEMAEAVNLELMNMSSNISHGLNGSNGLNGVNGLNGIPVKNPNSTVINMTNPYDEYFIPVNEHRKYMRYLLPTYLPNVNKIRAFSVFIKMSKKGNCSYTDELKCLLCTNNS